MKIEDFFIMPPGTQLRIETQPNADVLTYVVFVRKWTGGGDIPDTTLFPDQLQAPGGATQVLAAERGYDLILQASVRPQGQAAMDVSLTFSNPQHTARQYHVLLPDSADGSHVVRVLWSIVIH